MMPALGQQTPAPRSTARRISVNGVCLAVEIHGDASLPPLVLLHGFTGCRSAFDGVADQWPGWRRIGIDLIGHGGSDHPHCSERYSIPAACDDLLALFDRLALSRPVVLGYSMGGRVALHLALRAPERLRALILESASPGIEEPAERAARVVADHRLADRIESNGIAWFVREWESLPLFAGLRRLPARSRESLHRQRLANDPCGLAGSLRGMGAGTTEPVLDQLDKLRLPTLLVVGAMDQRYVDLGRSMNDRLPGSELAVIPDAGHTVHLEQPQAFAAAVSSFLERVSPQEVS